MHVCKCAIKRSVIFNSECTRTVCQPGSPDTLEELPLLPRLPREEPQMKGGKEKEGKEGADEEGEESEREGREGKGQGSIPTLLYPLPALTTLLMCLSHHVIVSPD